MAKYRFLLESGSENQRFTGNEYRFLFGERDEKHV